MNLINVFPYTHTVHYILVRAVDWSLVKFFPGPQLPPSIKQEEHHLPYLSQRDVKKFRLKKKKKDGENTL